MSPSDNHSRIELKFPNDPRAISAVLGAVEHMAQRAGFPTAQQKELAAAAEEACRAAFLRLGDHDATLRVVVQEFSDRIELILEHASNASAVPAKGSSQPKLACMDRVDYQTSRGVSRMKLVKYMPAPTTQT